jgi:hypothetical protein
MLVLRCNSGTEGKEMGMMWWLFFIVCAAGAVGGVVNALITDNGFVMPRREQVDQMSIVRPGYIGNILIGAIAAGVSWGLYGPLATYYIVVIAEKTSQPVADQIIGITLSSLVGAVLVGVGGARWLTNEVDKNLLKAAASKAAGAQATPSASQQIALASPAQALCIAKAMQP